MIKPPPPVPAFVIQHQPLLDGDPNAAMAHAGAGGGRLWLERVVTGQGFWKAERFRTTQGPYLGSREAQPGDRATSLQVLLSLCPTLWVALRSGEALGCLQDEAGSHRKPSPAGRHHPWVFPILQPCHLSWNEKGRKRRFQGYP